MRCEGLKWKCKICSDGRLYGGAWINETVVPDPLPFNEVLFDEFPENDNGGCDYIWDGEKLTYSPAETASEETNDVNA